MWLRILELGLNEVDMQRRMVILIILILVQNVSMSSELRFDKHGQLLLPDQTYLEIGVKSEVQGYPNDALRYLKKSARFGNPYAISTVAFIHFKNKDKINALAWFNLVDLNMIDNDQLIVDVKNELTSALSESDLVAVEDLTKELRKKYGKFAAQQYRTQWQNNISLGGTKLKGNIPNRVKIYPTARIEMNGAESEIFVSAVSVSGSQVKTQVNDFVYNYELKFIRGDVKLKDIELINKQNPL